MPDDSLNRIIENIIHESAVRSIRLRVSISESNGQAATPGAPPGLVVEQTYLETDGGERFFDERVSIPSQPVTHKSAYCDGQRCGMIRFSTQDPERQETMTIGHDFMNESALGYREAPLPFRYYHVGLLPLRQALAGAQRIGRESVMGRTCENFHFKEVGPPGAQQSLVYSLDHATSVPLRVAAYSGPEQLRDRAPNWVWEASSLDNVADRHFARSSTDASFQVTKSGTGPWISKPDVSHTIEVTEISFDTPVARTDFWPTFQAGIRISDSIANRSYLTPFAPKLAEQVAWTGKPVPAAPEQVPWLPALGVALSLVALGVALVLSTRSG
jgi:hypothetical protein